MASARQPLSKVAIRSQNHLYICHSCRSQLVQPTFWSTHHKRHATGGNLPFTEKIRRKIWGTDNPPGLADPYGGPSILEKRKLRKEAAQRGEVYVEENRPRLSQLSMEEPQQQQHDVSETTQSHTDQYNALEEQSSSSRTKQSELVDVNPHLKTLHNESLRPSTATVDDPLDSFESLYRDQEDTYVPAESLEELQWIGHLGEWKKINPTTQDQFKSWFNTAPRPAKNRQELLSCLHQAVVDCFACQELSNNTDMVSLLGVTAIDRQIYVSTKIIMSTDSLSGIAFASKAERDDFMDHLESVELTRVDGLTDLSTSNNASAEPTPHDMNNTKAKQSSRSDSFYYNVTDESFLAAELDLHDPLIFKILKRFTQLSGHRIPDPILSSAPSDSMPKTFSHVLDRVYDTVVKPQPKKLAQILTSSQTLNTLGNVMILPRRETPVDKEKEVGRWKIIEHELQRRGLPVLGKIRA